MRLFVALDLPSEIAAYLLDVQQELRKTVRSGRWQPLSNLHLTLHFLGEVDEGLLPRLVKDLEEVCAGFAPFSLTTGSLGVFPPVGQPRVLWLGVGGDVEPLKRIHRELRERFARHEGIALDTKPYRPHITLARNPDAAGVQQLLAGEGMLPQQLAWTVDRLHLYRSVLQPTGAVHTSLHTAALGISRSGQSSCRT